MPKQPKDEFEDLPGEFKEAIAGMDEAEIRDRIAKISLDNAALMEAKEQDDDLKIKKEIAKEAGAVYREGAKANKLKIKYARRVLGDKGKPNGDA